MNRFVLLITMSVFAIMDCLADEYDSLRLVEVRSKMDSLCVHEPAFMESVDISVGQMRLSELLRTIAKMKKVNLSVRDNFDCIVSCNFTSSPIDDLIVFLCSEYELDIDIYGNIVSIFQYVAPIVPDPPVIINCDADSLLSFSFENRILSEVTEHLISKTEENIIISNDIRNMRVSATAVRVTLSDALEIIAGGNGLEAFATKGVQKIWCLSRKAVNNSSTQRRKESEHFDSSDTTEVLPLRHRSVENILDIIPEALKNTVSILTSNEMNSLVIHGKKMHTHLIKEYVRRIDMTIPLVSIDVMIVETTKRFTRNVGLNAGRSGSPQETTARVGQGIDVVLGSSEVTSLLQKIDGFSNVNLGNVADNLYLELKLLENRGDIRLESTPKLATLNGHKASMSKGETIYYKEINTSYLGSQNPLQTSSYNWKSVDADLTLDITPYVSLDSLVTLEVDLVQSEFGAMKEENAPPPITKRSFKSIVRVAEGDVVLLGGLNAALDSDSRDGLPWIARVPVLRWIFGGHRREKSDSRLSIFIRAEIVG